MTGIKKVGVSAATVALVAGAVLMMAPDPAPAPDLDLITFGATNGPGLEWVQAVTTPGVTVTWSVEQSAVLPPVWMVQTNLTAYLFTNAVRVRYRFPMSGPQQFYRVGVRYGP